MSRDCIYCEGTGTVKYYRAASDAVKVRVPGAPNMTMTICRDSAIPGDMLDPGDRNRHEKAGRIVETEAP